MGLKIALSVLTLLRPGGMPYASPIQEPPPKTPPVLQDPATKPPAPQLLEGLEMESAINYDSDPKTPHILRAVFAGTDHARWWIGAGAEGAELRLLRLRSGERVFAMRLDTSGSVELAGAQRDEALAQLELRRALLQFETFAWKGEERTRTAAVGSLGSLRAQFDAQQDARPREITFLDPEGHAQDSCRAIRWDSSGPRTLPAALELWHGETRVWQETVRRVQPMSFALDGFLPPDRLEAQTPSGTWKVIPTPSPEYAARRFPLPADATWESARKELDRLRADWAPRLVASGLALEERGTLELDEQLRPRYVVLRLAKLPAKLPEGFEQVTGRSAVGTPLVDFAGVQPGALRALRAKVPPGAKTGAPYVRWALDPGGVKQVVLLLSWTAPK